MEVAVTGALFLLWVLFIFISHSLKMYKEKSQLPPGPTPWFFLGNLLQKDVMPLNKNYSKVKPFLVAVSLCSLVPVARHKQPLSGMKQCVEEGQKVNCSLACLYTFPFFLIIKACFEGAQISASFLFPYFYLYCLLLDFTRFCLLLACVYFACSLELPWINLRSLQTIGLFSIHSDLLPQSLNRSYHKK